MRLTGTYRKESLLKQTAITLKDDMKRTSNDPSLRNSTPAAYRTFGQNITNNDTTPQIVQRPRVDGSDFFSTAYKANVMLPELTDDFYAKLINPLEDKDFDQALWIAGVHELKDLLLLTDRLGNTLLHTAAKRNDIELIKVLLSMVDNPDDLAGMKDIFGNTPLIAAAKKGNSKSIEEILDGVKDPEQHIFERSNFDETSMMAAAGAGSVESIKVLFNRVKDKDKDKLASIKDENGRTALIHAVIHDEAESIKTILNQVKNPDALACLRDNKRNHALTIAANNNSFLSIEALLGGVKYPDTLAHMEDGEGDIALTYASTYNFYESIEAILTNVSNASQLILKKNLNGFNSFMLAASNGCAKTIKALLNRVEDPIELIYASSNKGETVLMICISNENEDNNINSNVINAIFEKVQEVQREKAREISDIETLIFLKDIEGMNAFMLAARAKNTIAALTLFNWTTDKLALMQEKNINNKTALDYLNEEMCDELIEKLENQELSAHIHDAELILSLLQKQKACFL